MTRSGHRLIIINHSESRIKGATILLLVLVIPRTGTSLLRKIITTRALLGTDILPKNADILLNNADILPKNTNILLKNVNILP